MIGAVLAVSEVAVATAVLILLVTSFTAWALVMSYIDRRREEREDRATRAYWRGLP